MSTLTADHNMIAAETTATTPVRKPFFSRLLNGIVEAQQRRADREIARYLASRGPLTDELERDLMRRLSDGKRL